MDYRSMPTRNEHPPTVPTPPLSPQEWFQQPTIVVCVAVLAFTVLYQTFHTSPYDLPRHPGEVLWDFVVTLTPAWLLYTIDSWVNPPLLPLPEHMRPARPGTYAAKSELLRKLLGMDKPGGGIIGSVASAGRKSLSTLSGGGVSFRAKGQQPAGLGNVDYACFQNSILQGLSSLTPLPRYLDSAIEEPESKESEGSDSSASTLQRLIAQLRDPENNGKTLWTPAKLKSLRTWEQQDAQEYFSKLLDEIEKEAATVAKAQQKAPGLDSTPVRDDTESQHSDDSGYQSLSTLSKTTSESKVVRNPLEGLTAQRVACVKCGYSEGLSLVPFNCLTLNLGVGTMQHDLFELLDNYTQLESIEGVECAKCTLLKAQRLLNILLERSKDKPEEALRETKSRLEAVETALEEDDFEEKTLKENCKISGQLRSSSTKTKQVVIARPPRSLAIHMNRSVFDENTGNMWKNLAAVKFPRTLDLGPWCLGSANHATLSRDRAIIDEEKDDIASDKELWVSDPKASMISGDASPSKISGPIYDLRAVVTHQGQHENGHYVCYRRHVSRTTKAEDESVVAENDAKPDDDEKTLVDTTENEGDGEQWWRLSDETVWDVTEENVLAQGGVFMLFYDCVEPNSVLVYSLDGKDEDKVTTRATSEVPASDASTIANTAYDGDSVRGTNFKQESPLESLTPNAEVYSDVAAFEKSQDTATEPSHPVHQDKEDTFVFSLLNRPNSGNSVRPASKDAPAVPISTRHALQRDTRDSFVASLLARPNC
jgi:ubiquitin carboxyl-terminal hydrolase 1